MVLVAQLISHRRTVFRVAALAVLLLGIVAGQSCAAKEDKCDGSRVIRSNEAACYGDLLQNQCGRFLVSDLPDGKKACDFRDCPCKSTSPTGPSD